MFVHANTHAHMHTRRERARAHTARTTARNLHRQRDFGNLRTRTNRHNPSTCSESACQTLNLAVRVWCGVKWRGYGDVHEQRAVHTAGDDSSPSSREMNSEVMNSECQPNSIAADVVWVCSGAGVVMFMSSGSWLVTSDVRLY